MMCGPSLSFQPSVADKRYKQTATCFLKAVKRMRGIQAGLASPSTMSQSGTDLKMAGGTFSFEVRLPPPRMM